jgi:tetratricopeptide (TPR) repeat protein
MVAVAYSQVVSFGFVNFDDDLYTFANPHVISGTTFENVVWAFTTFFASNWHPLTWLSLQADSALFGSTAAGFHGTNAAVHAANSALVYLALYRLTGRRTPSFLAAELFALHPLHAESVAWVSERKDVLSTFFGLAALIGYAAYARQRSVGRYLVVTVLFVFSLLAKPTLVTLPCLFLVLDVWPLRRSASWRDLVLEKAPWLVLAAASCVVTVIAQHDALAAPEVIPLASRLANAAAAYAIYLRKTFWPSDLAPFYPLRGFPPLFDWLGGLALVGALTIAAVQQRIRRPYLLTGWVWFLGTLVPTIGIVQVGSQSLADRYSYFPLIGIFVAVCWAIPSRPAWIGAVAAVAFLLVGGAATLSQAAKWRDSETLWRHALAVVPDNEVARFSLGDALLSQGRGAEAEREFRRCVELNPHYARGLTNLGTICQQTGRLDEAFECYSRAVAADPKCVEAQNNLGSMLVDRGAIAEAMDHFAAAVRWKPDYADAHNNWGTALEELGDLRHAVEHYAAAARLKPDLAVAQSNLGTGLLKLGRPDLAIAHLESAAHLEPKNPDFHRNLARAYRDLKRLDAAANEMRIAEECSNQTRNP